VRVKTEAKRDAIIKAASEVFLESGFEGASMAEIAARVGGSKATLYGYFSSKEELFLEVTNSEAKQQFDPLLVALAEDTDNIRQALQRFGERTLAVLCSEKSIQARRAIIAEAGRSDIGKRFFEMGPKVGLTEISRFMEKQMSRGVLRQRDPMVAACQLFALLDAETVIARLYGVEPQLSRAQIRRAVNSAVETFIGGYGAGAGVDQPVK